MSKRYSSNIIIIPRLHIKCFLNIIYFFKHPFYREYFHRDFHGYYDLYISLEFRIIIKLIILIENYTYRFL